MTITTVVLILIMLLPTPRFTAADVDGFERACRTLWRGLVITAKLLALTIALVVAVYEFGGRVVGATVSGALLGVIGLRLVLWAGEFIIPDGLHRFLSEKTDPDYLLKIVF